MEFTYKIGGELVLVTESFVVRSDKEIEATVSRSKANSDEAPLPFRFLLKFIYSDDKNAPLSVNSSNSENNTVRIDIVAFNNRSSAGLVKPAIIANAEGRRVFMYLSFSIVGNEMDKSDIFLLNVTYTITIENKDAVEK